MNSILLNKEYKFTSMHFSKSDSLLRIENIYDSGYK